jgi:hypothetical protein
VIGNQRVDQFVQIAFHDPVELVKREINAVIGDAALREVIGTDSLGAVARATWLRRDSERSFSAF